LFEHRVGVQSGHRANVDRAYGLLAVPGVFINAFVGSIAGIDMFRKFGLFSDLRKQHAVQEFFDFQLAGLNG